MVKGGTVYILTNKSNKVLYIGVTADIVARLYEHKNKIFPQSFTARYNLHKLVYFENYNSITEAIQREKYLKGKLRSYKINLIISKNPEWRDLSADVM